MADGKIVSLQQFFSILTVVIFNFIYIEECFTLKLAILCQKMPEKKDVDFRRTGLNPRLKFEKEHNFVLKICKTNT